MKKIISISLIVCIAILSTSCSSKNDVTLQSASLPESYKHQSSESIPSSEITSSTESNHLEIFSLADYVATTPEDIFDIADIVISGSFSENVSTYVSDATQIITESMIDVVKVLKGEYLEKSIKISYYGGTVLLSEYIEKLKPSQIEKRGYNEFSSLDRSSKTISYEVTDQSVSFDNATTLDADSGNEFLIFLSYDANKDMYFVLCDAYGARRLNGNTVYNLESQNFEVASFLTENNVRE